MPIGLGFADALTGKSGQQQGPSGGQTPIQDAIKVLSLKIPQFVGASPLAPGQLLNGQGSAGFPFSGGMPGGLEQFLAQLFGQMGQNGQPGMAGMNRAPMPSIVPGGKIGQTPAPPLEATQPVSPMNRNPDGNVGGIVKPGTIQPSGAPRPAPVFGGRPIQRLV
jgi:hypothetical protein